MRLGRGLEYGGNITWSLDFVSDSLANGRRIKCLTIADDFTRECIDIAVDLSMPGAYCRGSIKTDTLIRSYPIHKERLNP